MPVVDLESNGILSTKVCRAGDQPESKVVEFGPALRLERLSFEFEHFLSAHPFLYYCNTETVLQAH